MPPRFKVQDRLKCALDPVLMQELTTNTDSTCMVSRLMFLSGSGRSLTDSAPRLGVPHEELASLRV
jgi:hypothetical protein